MSKAYDKYLHQEMLKYYEEQAEMDDMATEVDEAFVIEEWSCTGSINLYQAPELQRLYIVGKCPERFPGNDEPIRTSYVVEVSGRFIRTVSGSLYKLGEPSEQYREWLRENRPDWDPENPIIMRG
jgi:hypothetical protein